MIGSLGRTASDVYAKVVAQEQAEASKRLSSFSAIEEIQLRLQCAQIATSAYPQPVDIMQVTDLAEHLYNWVKK